MLYTRICSHELNNPLWRTHSRYFIVGMKPILKGDIFSAHVKPQNFTKQKCATENLTKTIFNQGRSRKLPPLTRNYAPVISTGARILFRKTAQVDSLMPLGLHSKRVFPLSSRLARQPPWKFSRCFLRRRSWLTWGISQLGARCQGPLAHR